MRKITRSGAFRRQFLVVIGATLATSAIGIMEASASTKSYQINGRWYQPHAASGYDRTGVASYYGPGFHGRKTANGETYDQWGMTAAHPTLPMGTQVYVTNQRTGKTVKVRINDRGPFAGGRIIDLSTHVAEVLGIKSSGVGQVRVRYAGLGHPAEERRTIAKKKNEDDDQPRAKVAVKADKPEKSEKPKGVSPKVASRVSDDDGDAKPKAATVRKASGVPVERPAQPVRRQREHEPLPHENLIMPGMADAGRDPGHEALLRMTRKLEEQVVAEVTAEWRKALAARRVKT